MANIEHELPDGGGIILSRTTPEEFSIESKNLETIRKCNEIEKKAQGILDRARAIAPAKN